MEVRGHTGLPLLSGPPPPESASTRSEDCRKCQKEFNVVFARSKRCNHCGHLYCNTCTDYQALMPRPVPESGYTSQPVCAFCIEFLTLTAMGRGQLKSVALSKLRRYIEVYNIKINRVVEKDDLIDAILAARGPNGCLPKANEDYYRRYSIPNNSDASRPRGIFSRLADLAEPNSPPRRPPVVPPRPERPPTQEFARPDLAPDYPPPPPPQARPAASSSPNTPPRPSQPAAGTSYRPPGHPRMNAGNPQQQQSHPYQPPRPSSTPPRTQPQQSSSQPHPQPQPAHSPSAQNLNVPRPAGNASARPRSISAAPSPPPTLSSLLEMEESSISRLSISTLKAILFASHVNAGLILEKSELVAKVTGLVEEERRRIERHRLLEEQEEQERIERQREMLEEFERAKRAKDAEAAEGNPRNSSGESSTSIPAHDPPPYSEPVAKAKAAATAALQRDGLCVICQDEEANIAVVDCGHLAMCRDCSDLVMASSRECPLCRTRIVTEARLLRIFKS